jgi:transcriptional regulator with XRE-family HTH domain
MSKNTHVCLEPEVFAKRLFSLREAADLSQKDVAEMTGIPPSVVCHFERGTRIPSLNSAIKLAHGLDISLDYLSGLSTQHTVTKAQNKMIENLHKLSPEYRTMVTQFVEFLVNKTNED